MSETEMHENPLVPNTKLRQMYMAMAEARVLDEHIAKLQKTVKGRRRLKSTRGQEACRVSTAIDLGPGDLVSDSQVGVVMDLIAGAKVSSLVKRVAEIHSGRKTRGAKLGETSGRVLPWIEDAGERLRMAMGAALSFKTLGRTNVVVAYVRHGEVGKGVWRRVLALAGRLELPVIFVILPAVKGERRDGVANLSAKTARWGVPGIPVDAGDAVALYRVAQESLGRTRGGDGPVLIECAAYRMEGSAGDTAGDPLVQMEEFLLGRKVCTKAWLERAGERLRRRIAAAR
ncbi:MAG TPA: thiamine pyrophosphate-dependent enzyme [Edaphobacter sp.]|nr:thiamine pyrophosphate-dependent enzyme [Edaphobacter sp.]